MRRRRAHLENGADNDAQSVLKQTSPFVWQEAARQHLL